MVSCTPTVQWKSEAQRGHRIHKSQDGHCIHLTNTENRLCASHCSKCTVNIILFNPPKNPEGGCYCLSFTSDKAAAPRNKSHFQGHTATATNVGPGLSCTLCSMWFVQLEREVQVPGSVGSGHPGQRAHRSAGRLRAAGSHTAGGCPTAGLPQTHPCPAGLRRTPLENPIHFCTPEVVHHSSSPGLTCPGGRRPGASLSHPARAAVSG